MEIQLDEKYSNLKLKANNNIIFIYGQNTFGKTYFLNYFKAYLTKKQVNIFSDLKFDDDRQIVEIGEEWDLKKELSLSKTSPIRKFILTDVLDELEKKNIDLVEEFRKNKSLNLVKENIDKIVQIEEDEYYIKSDFSFKSDPDIIDNLFKLKIINEKNNEINESIIPKSIKSQLFSKLLIEANSKNKIILFDCPETYLDNHYQNKFSNLIDNLSKDNIVIATYRNSNFLSNINFNIDEIYFLNKDTNIEKLFISKTSLLQMYLLMNKNFNSFNLETLKDFEEKIRDVEHVSNDSDFESIKNKVFKKFIPIFLANIDFKNNKLNLDKLDLFTESELMIFILLAKYNNIYFDDFEFNNKLLKDFKDFLD